MQLYINSELSLGFHLVFFRFDKRQDCLQEVQLTFDKVWQRLSVLSGVPVVHRQQLYDHRGCGNKNAQSNLLVMSELYAVSLALCQIVLQDVSLEAFVIFFNGGREARRSILS